MIDAMNILILTVAAILAGLALASWLGAAVYDYVAHDGYGRPRPSAPPRSHHTYFDDPRGVA